ncbi:MAG: PQQ-binding-like beta-propeller repeat protein, partial [candidate division WOR-3 bacterium]
MKKWLIINKNLFIMLLGLFILTSIGFPQQEIWVYKHQDGAGQGRHNGLGNAVVIGHDGNIYIAGTTAKTEGSFASYFTVISLTPNRELRWEYYHPQEHPIQASDNALSLVYGKDNRIYAVGKFLRANGDDDILVVCLDSKTGNNIWSKLLGTVSNDCGYSITYGEDGNIYICGQITGTPLYKFYVASLNRDGDIRWEYSIAGSGTGSNKALSIIYGPGEYIYVAGYLTNWNPPNGQLYDAVVMSLNTSGQLRWTYTYNPYNFDDSATCVIKGLDGKIYVTGSSSASYSSTYYDIFVSCIDTATGNLLWPRVFRWNGTGPSGHADGAARIIYGNDDNLYLCGSSDTTWSNSYRHADFYAMSLVKDNPTVPRWCYRYGPVNNKNDYAYSIAYGLDNNIYVVGQSAYTNSDAQYTLISLNKDNGNSRFIYLYPTPNPSSSYTHSAYDVVYGADASIYSCGYSYYFAVGRSCSLTVIKHGIPNCLGNGTTHPSQARHLVKDPFSPNLHMVFEYDNRIYYRLSTDNGTTWCGAEYLGRGRDPSIALAITHFFAMIPCVAYCDIDTANRLHYHWNETGTWQHAILPVPGANPCTPSMVAAGNTVFIAYELRWELGEQERPCIMCKHMIYNDPLTQVDELITGSDVGTPDQPSLAVDNNYGIHCAWHWYNGYDDDDIAYSYRDPNTGQWTPA